MTSPLIQTLLTLFLTANSYRDVLKKIPILFSHCLFFLFLSVFECTGPIQASRGIFT